MSLLTYDEIGNLYRASQDAGMREPGLPSTRFALAIEAAVIQKLMGTKVEPSAWITPDGEGFRIRFNPPEQQAAMGWVALLTTEQLAAAVLQEREKEVQS